MEGRTKNTEVMDHVIQLKKQALSRKKQLEDEEQEKRQKIYIQKLVSLRLK